MYVSRSLMYGRLYLRRKWHVLQVCLVAAPLAWTTLAVPAHAAQSVGCTALSGGSPPRPNFALGETCQIHEPVVTAHATTIPQIMLQAGDQVYFTAHGCVQTGGSGKTWKLWLNPRGPNSDKLYHGLIALPGATNGLARLQAYNAKYVAIPATVKGQVPLQLGYEDDNYADNGYWGHDDGTGNQCKGVENAWLEIQISHSPK